jgi:hypothetical protein
MYCGGLGDPLSPPDIGTTSSAPATATKPLLNQRVAEIESQAKPYAAGREILPVVEVIATVVQGSSGRDGKYRVRLTDAQIATYHKTARSIAPCCCSISSQVDRSSSPKRRRFRSG